jgi:serine/threonine protein phosphatase PrpC
VIAGYVCEKGFKLNAKKINQDNFLFLTNEQESIFGVFDGHGPLGHHVSAFIRKHIHRVICILKKTMKFNDAALLKASYKVLQNLLENSEVDCFKSGSTCVTAIVSNNSVCVANLGDSRAIISRKQCKIIIFRNN